MALWPFGKKEEDETAAPNTAIIRVPKMSSTGAGQIGEEFIRVRFNENGEVAARDKVPRDEAYEFIDSGEAFMATEQQVEKITMGKKSISEVYRESMMEDESEQPVDAPQEEGYIEGRRRKSPIGGEARKRQMDKTIEEATGGGY